MPRESPRRPVAPETAPAAREGVSLDDLRPLAFPGAASIFAGRHQPSMTNSPHSDTTTDGIRIQAAAEFLPQENLPPEFLAADRDQKKHFVFRYKITMRNVGDVPARLLTRHWIIVDGEGRREDVRGRGVIGEFPKLGAGESYSYVSFCPLATSWGTMEGTYTFERDDGKRFQVKVGRFFLVPTAPHLQLESPSR